MRPLKENTVDYGCLQHWSQIEEDPVDSTIFDELCTQLVDTWNQVREKNNLPLVTSFPSSPPKTDEPSEDPETNDPEKREPNDPEKNDLKTVLYSLLGVIGFGVLLVVGYFWWKAKRNGILL
jgi:hypothetical protein